MARKSDPRARIDEINRRAKAKLAEIERGADGPRFSAYCPHEPTAKQREFLGLACLEALYGGAAGGGKSDALLMAALQYADVAGYSALLLRRTYADLSLPGALMDRAHDWLAGSDARWDEREKTWTFPAGASVTFGYLESRTDHLRYQGSEFQFIGFDELTQFPEKQYRYLLSRLRRKKSLGAIPLRMRAGSNPGGPGHAWVKQRFLVESDQKDRIFVPARLDDNPHLDAAEYEKSLAGLDGVTRAQLRNGDWEIAAAGDVFRRDWFQIATDFPSGMRLHRAWDLAATAPKPGADPDYTVGALVGAHDGIFWILDIVRARLSPAGVERLIRQTAERDGPTVKIWIEQEPGSSGVNTIDRYARSVLTGFPVRGVRTTGSKSDRAAGWAAAAENGNVRLLRGKWIIEFLDEAAVFPGGDHDDQVDAVSLGYLAATGRRGGTASA
jgi:predicted phage terminase large subunit-like protein